jgi:hypothetical protein
MTNAKKVKKVENGIRKPHRSGFVSKEKAELQFIVESRFVASLLQEAIQLGAEDIRVLPIFEAPRGLKL